MVCFGALRGELMGLPRALKLPRTLSGVSGNGASQATALADGALPANRAGGTFVLLARSVARSRDEPAL